MAKQLGQIHSCNEIMNVTAFGDKFAYDLPGILTSQLQRMVRAGTYHKVVGIDMTLDPAGVAGGGSVTGRFLYYSPTRGRCSAFRGAFRSMTEQMKTQGISMRDNAMYDFKAPLNSDATLNTFPNRATLNGTDGLALHNTAVVGASIFDVHNKSVQPIYTGSAGDLYSEGFDTLLQARAGGTDFILNDAVPFTGDPDLAQTLPEEIPFTVSWEPATATSGASVTNFQWRPDPALFLAVLCGQLQIVIDNVQTTGGAPGVDLNVNIMVSGWKSIMGNPEKRKRMKAKTSDKNKKA